MIGRLLLMVFSMALFLVTGCRKSDYILAEEYIVIRDTGNGTGTTTWKAGVKYLLDGKVFVNDGQTLTIEPGATIFAKTGQGENASALIVARGGRIIAQGTREKPIIFTVEGDDLMGSVPLEANGLWGGVIILGSAPVNNENGESFIEGIILGEPRATYGGNNPEDNSGILKYVSIRHSGTSLSAGNEINGLTLGGVGNSTVIEYVEVISNRDDGFEFFGGTVNARYLVSAFCMDDAFDFDQGYTGNCQYLVGIQNISTGDLLMEFSDRENYPATRPVIGNGTFIGRGPSANGQVLRFDNSSSGRVINSIFVNQKNGLEIEYSGNQLDSYQQFLSGKLVINNNLFYHVGNNSALQIFGVYSNVSDNITEQDQIFKAYFEEGENAIFDAGITYEQPYNLIPQNTGYGLTAEAPNSWFEPTNFKGALNDQNWLKGWTLLDQAGLIE